MSKKNFTFKDTSMKDLINYFNSIRVKLGKSNLPLHEPDIDYKDQKEVIKGLKSGYVSSVGNDIIRFEKKLKYITKSKFIIPTINGTSALHVALKMVGVKPEDEILVPSLSFVASVNAVLYNNATPHFVDSEIDHFGIDPKKLDDYLKKNTFIKKNFCVNKKTKKIVRALVLVHVFGHPAKISEILFICKKHKIKIVEDAAEALGSLYKGKHVGTYGDIGILSFNGNKIVTTGVGGAILTNSKKLAENSKHLTTTAKIKHKWDFVHDKLGYNYRIANLNASLGISQLEKLPRYIDHKRKLFYRLHKLFKNSNDFIILREPENCRSNFWLQTLVLKKSSKLKKNDILKELHKKKILARPVWRPLHKMKYLKKYPKMNLDNAKSLENRIINLPSSYYI